MCIFYIETLNQVKKMNSLKNFTQLLKTALTLLVVVVVVVVTITPS